MGFEVDKLLNFEAQTILHEGASKSQKYLSTIDKKNEKRFVSK